MLAARHRHRGRLGFVVDDQGVEAEQDDQHHHDPDQRSSSLCACAVVTLAAA